MSEPEPQYVRVHGEACTWVVVRVYSDTVEVASAGRRRVVPRAWVTPTADPPPRGRDV